MVSQLIVSLIPKLSYAAFILVRLKYFFLLALGQALTKLNLLLRYRVVGKPLTSCRS